MLLVRFRVMFMLLLVTAILVTAILLVRLRMAGQVEVGVRVRVRVGEGILQGLYLFGKGHFQHERFAAEGGRSRS